MLCSYYYKNKWLWKYNPRKSSWICVYLILWNILYLREENNAVLNCEAHVRKYLKLIDRYQTQK